MILMACERKTHGTCNFTQLGSRGVVWVQNTRLWPDIGAEPSCGRLAPVGPPSVETSACADENPASNTAHARAFACYVVACGRMIIRAHVHIPLKATASAVAA
jgi:hypothetical protein